MSNRDDFPKKIRNAVALRANHRCSFRGCPQTTSGPSAESPEAVNRTGRAAHIHGAASGPGSRRYTPLQCVERVFGITILATAPTKNWLPIRVDLDVKGLGRWQHDLSVCVPPEPIRRPSFDDLLAGPSAYAYRRPEDAA